jgi:hypothetical protein
MKLFIIKFLLCFVLIFPSCSQIREPASSVSIVSGYGLDDRAIQVRSRAGAKDFSSNLCVYRGSFSRGKARPGRDDDHSPPSSAEGKNE